ncbi:MAG: hypothetical protein ACLFUR_02735 [Candidatus Hadarchaeia archaeon]
MNMFEGKKGYRIYVNKEDAESLSRMARKRGVKTKIVKVRITDGVKAKNMGFTIHSDISIAASPPTEGKEGWIIIKENENTQKNLGESVEIIGKPGNRKTMIQ